MEEPCSDLDDNRRFNCDDRGDKCVSTGGKYPQRCDSIIDCRETGRDEEGCDNNEHQGRLG